MMMPHIKQSEHLKINLQAIELATNNFAAANYIGEGGFGKVYKGEIDHYEGHTMAAFKRLDLLSGSRQGDQEFSNEIMILFSYKHKNILSLSENGMVQRVVHCDIKSSNILIDKNWEAMISDFGLSKLCPADKQISTVFTNPVGTKAQHVGILNLRVIKAMNLKRVFKMFSPSTYVKLSLTKDDTFNKSKVVKRKVNPVWNEEFDLLVSDPHLEALEIVVSRDKGQAKNSKSPVWNNEKFEFIFDRQPTENILLYLHVHGSSWFQSYFGKNTFQIRSPKIHALATSENYIYISLADVMKKIYIKELYGLTKSKNKNAGLRVEGGFGKVYKGEIDNTMVALKRLDREFGQGDPEFWKEIMMLSVYKHDNIVSLLGYCDDCGEKILMYEYLPKKSLDRYLKSSELSWVRRLKLCIGRS
ncbi:kinase RLK-Pelle-CrRLK1L-1 family protein [Tanacetum coccineum]|uniref:Kinase RLK-Pelle-CrRLK1L-1 family protein n=1 Tax=Tanacetum coccineum TaxID=301880 RepID=A0ABQ5HQ48_9ASTR